MRSDSAVFGCVGDAGGPERSDGPNVVPGKEPPLPLSPNEQDPSASRKRRDTMGPHRRRANTKDTQGPTLKRARMDGGDKSLVWSVIGRLLRNQPFLDFTGR